MFYPLALLAALVSEPSPSWRLQVAIEDEADIIWLSAEYATEEECQEDLLVFTLVPPTRGRVVGIYCERDPFEV